MAGHDDVSKFWKKCYTLKALESPNGLIATVANLFASQRSVTISTSPAPLCPIFSKLRWLPERGSNLRPAD
jgi:hypothetical protein